VPLSKLIGNAILSILTIVIFFFGYLSIFVLASSGIVVWIAVLGLAIAAYGVAIVKVARYFGIPLGDKLSEMSPVFVAGLESFFPGVGFVYLGKQKQTNYILVGLAVFAGYIITCVVFISSPLINLAWIPIIAFRAITPYFAYTTVQKLKRK